MSRRKRVALLDVNVLFALFDPAHVHHDVAHDWFADHNPGRWASCPLTENGFLRTAATVARGREPLPLADLAAALRTFCANGRHEFWFDEVTLTDDDLFEVDAVLGHQQLTDVYLLALAVKHAGMLATFDRNIPLTAVKGATREHLAVLAPEE